MGEAMKMVHLGLTLFPLAQKPWRFPSVGGAPSAHSLKDWVRISSLNYKSVFSKVTFFYCSGSHWPAKQSFTCSSIFVSPA
jgi:hypothetical protein